MAVAKNEHPGIVKALMKRNAKLDKKNEYGKTALMIAKENFKRTGP